MTPDDVRQAADRLRSDGSEYWFAIDHLPLAARDARLLARFADAVLKPPADVRLALGRFADQDGPYSKRGAAVQIADWIVSLITPAAKETT